MREPVLPGQVAKRVQLVPHRSRDLARLGLWENLNTSRTRFATAEELVAFLTDVLCAVGAAAADALEVYP